MSTTGLDWYLGGQVSPSCLALILHSDRIHSGQDHIFGDFYSKTTHACNEDVGSAHPVHRLMTQNIPVHVKGRVSLWASGLCSPYLSLTRWFYLQLSRVESFIDVTHL